MYAVVVAAGELPAETRNSLLPVFAAADLVVAADGGLDHCHALGTMPHVVVGDLDSADAGLVVSARAAGVEFVEYPSDKNATDLELALACAIERGADSVTVVCPFGNRLDHELATIGALASTRWGHTAIDAYDGRRRLWVIRSAADLQLPIGRTLSLVPWADEVTGVTTRGMRWPLRDETLALGSTRGVSNICDEPTQHINVASGTLLAITDSLGAATSGS